MRTLKVILRARELTPALVLASLLAASSAYADPIDDVVKATMAKEHIPGVAVGVIKDGKLVVARGYGTADLEADEPVVPETEFLIASMSKQFCAESILLLAAEGKLSIDDPISKYVEGTPESWSKITLRNLLSHQSGIHDIVSVEGFSFLDPTWTPRRILAKLSPLPLDFDPGDRFFYSNWNYYLLGWTVEKVSGMSLAEFARKRIFEPVGMTHTRYSRYADLVPRRARAYLWHEGTQTYTNEWAGRPPAADGSGAVITTLADWAKYDASLDAGSPISKAIQTQMGTGVPFNSGVRSKYGFGWYDDGDGAVHHTGGSYGFSTVFIRDPKRHVTVVVFRNAKGGPVLEMGRDIMAAYDLTRQPARSGGAASGRQAG